MSKKAPNLILEERLVPDIIFHAAPKSDAFQVNHDYNFRLDYNGDNSNCIAELIQTSTAQDGEELFKLSVTMRGFFRCEGIEDNDDKIAAHILAYQLLFPHMQAFIRSLTVEVGLPPMVLLPQPPDPNLIQFGSTP